MSNNQILNKESRAGFTLVEVLTALFLVIVGIGSAYALVNQSLALTKSAALQVTAAYLGKEGIEIARSIRDDNYLKILYSEPGYDGVDAWRSGLCCAAVDDCLTKADCQDGCAADYTSDKLATNHVGDRLRYDASGFYGYSGADASLYERTITVTPETDYLQVTVLVQWDERGIPQSLTVEENLYNWWPQ
jgi:hypothetical protein